jgi:MFS family permease
VSRLGAPARPVPRVADAPPNPELPSGRRVGLINLLAAETISTIGSRMSFLAIPWLVLVTTGSPTRMGLVAGVAALSHVLSGIFGTPYVNRIGVRRSVILSNAGCTVAMGTVAAFYHVGFAVLVGMVAVNGILAGVGDRALRVLLGPVAEVAGAPMPRVTAIFDGLNRTATIVAASVGGVLIAWLGPLAVVWLDAASFAACSAIVLFFVHLPRSTTEPAEPGAKASPEPYFTALRGGFEHLRSDQLLVGIVTMMFVLNLFNQASAVVYVPLWVRDVLHSPVALGFVAGSFAVGAITGNVAFAALANRLPRYLTFVVGYFIGGAPRFLILALSHRIEVVVAVTFICGVATSSVNPTIGALLYQRVPSALQARVFGLCGAISYGGLAIGGLVGAWAVAGLGLTGGLILAGVCYFTATLTPVLRRRIWRQIDDLPRPATRGRDPRELPGVAAVVSAAMWAGDRLGLYRPDDVTSRVAPLTVVFAYERDGWMVHAWRGPRRILQNHPISTVDALKKITMLDVPSVSKHVEQVHADETAWTEQRRDQLRAELISLESLAGFGRVM